MGKDLVLALACGRRKHNSSPASPASGGSLLKRCWEEGGWHLSAIFWGRGTLGAPSLGPMGSGAPSMRPPNHSEHLVNRVGVRAREALRGGVGGRGRGAALHLAPGGRLLRAGRRLRRRVGQQKRGRGGALGGDALHDAGQAVEARHRSALPGPGFCAGRGRLVCRGAQVSHLRAQCFGADGETKGRPEFVRIPWNFRMKKEGTTCLVFHSRYYRPGWGQGGPR